MNYITIPIALPGDEGLRNPDKEVSCKIDPASILAYHEGYSWGVFIYLKTGQAFCSTLTVCEFEKIITPPPPGKNVLKCIQ
ncbi:MAG: hypothetical protein KF862_07250 [Chitinophagaceae bacterium]|nr:hypothetical protein [Chitinophagaceae bacterium]